MMNKIFVVRKGKHYMGKRSMLYIGKDYKDCEEFIMGYGPLERGEKLYIDQVDRISEKDLDNVMQHAKNKLSEAFRVATMTEMHEMIHNLRKND